MGMKRAAVWILLVCVLVICTGCGDIWMERRERVFEIVRENGDVLLADIAKADFTTSAAIDGIEDVYPEWTFGELDFVEYYCGGAGFGASTAYYGFYYSKEDDLDRIWCAGAPLVPSGDGFLYEQSDGDNRYYTERIVDHFYYYEASY